MRADLTGTDLGRVIRRLEAKHRSRPLASRGRSLEEMPGAAIEETARGPILAVRSRFDLDHRHGRQRLAGGPAVGSLGLLSRPGAEPLEGRRLLFLDTETTGLAGGTGTYAFLVGLGFFDDEGFEVRQYFMRDLDEEPALLAAVEAVFQDFDGFVTYNGGGFDLPLLETRFVLGRQRWRDDRVHLDLLGPARRLWSSRLADCRLATVERAVLRFTREDDLPGGSIPTAYFDYLRRKQPGQMPRVFEHNRHDLLSLAALTSWVADAVDRAPADDLHPEELAALGRLWERVDVDRGLACYRMALDLGLSSPSREETLLRLALREKRRARWDEARVLWEAAIDGGGFDPRPWEEMAKLYEHRWRDLGAALSVVEAALLSADRHGANPRVVEALAHRSGRLTRKLERATARRETPSG